MTKSNINKSRRRNDLPFDKPNRDSNVWPKQSCPVFSPRKNAAEGIKECWYCAYAEFHLGKQKPLDVGICNWPRKS